ncbi:MAG: galactokinase [Anaerolineaceae bacterium]|nr:galactokinase [Anaerolineaceae bacterium]
MSLQQQITTEFQQRFNQLPTFVVRAPGRVNLIGEHTDYNEGFVLPMTINRSMWIALRPRDDQKVIISSLDFPDFADFSLDEIIHGESWDEYVRGMAWVLQTEGYHLQGWEGILASDIPVGAGLSSSAALELSVARAFWAISRWDWNPTKMALAAQRTENEWLGLKSGIMDQMISSNGKEDHVLLIDCRDLTSQLIPLPEGVSVVVLDTASRRSLIDSAYNERVTQCKLASDFFGVVALRDIPLAILETRSVGLDALIRRRARHVVTENNRTLQAAEAMQAGDAIKLGQLMNASHLSLRDDYEVSSEELNTMVEIADSQPGCFGARMTGAGFGGCAVALVQNSSAPSFADEVAVAYQEQTGFQPYVYICHPTNGAELVEG